jgi:hypothetical protein
VELNIARHGGTPGWIECLVEDTGEVQIPSELINALLARGFSGYPALIITRHQVDSTATEAGCVELRVESSAALDVAIPGLISCSDNGDCPEPLTCQGDLRCG